MIRSTLFLIIFIVSGLTCFGQQQKDLNVDYMLRGSIYVKSSVVDTLTFGGFGSSANAAQKISDSMFFSEEGFFIKIDTSIIRTFYKEYNGYTLLIVNKSDSVISLRASDSKLNILAEVYYDGKWQAIEFFPRSTCGNSFHKVFLKQNEYWSCVIPKFSGKKNTVLRYRLALGNNTFIYSNAIATSINAGQMSKVEGYKPGGLMDPYRE